MIRISVCVCVCVRARAAQVVDHGVEIIVWKDPSRTCGDFKQPHFPDRPIHQVHTACVVEWPIIER